MEKGLLSKVSTKILDFIGTLNFFSENCILALTTDFRAGRNGNKEKYLFYFVLRVLLPIKIQMLGIENPKIDIPIMQGTRIPSLRTCIEARMLLAPPLHLQLLASRSDLPYNSKNRIIPRGTYGISSIGTKCNEAA
jgi:hypothetical protein